MVCEVNSCQCDMNSNWRKLHHQYPDARPCRGLTVLLGAVLLGFRAVGCGVSQAIFAAMPSGPPKLIRGQTCRQVQGGKACMGLLKGEPGK